ncbi:MAG: prepilin-type N-terminal cleavage/methylation domain-containing protein [Lentimonas sp.]|jgi:prepilin-type N-terminal cleavage/methylation domain-containing protein
MNKKTYKTKRKAFSLIELSIVLIIIGLLVAGVTGGASLIKNAELRKVVEEARGYQTAVNSFFAKYNALPGDFGTAIGTQTGTATGNDDGAIAFINVNATGGRMEGNIAWQMLVNDNFIDNDFTPASADLSSGTTYTVQLNGGGDLPESNSQGGGWAFDNISSQNVVILMGGSTPASLGTLTANTPYNMLTTSTAALTNSTAAATTGNAQLLGTDALSLDRKVDDGIANAGDVRGVLASCNATTTYTTTNPFSVCALSFKVGDID